MAEMNKTANLVEEIQQSNRVEYNVDHQKFWDPCEWKAVPRRTTPFLHHSNSTFNLRNVLIGAGQVDHWTTRQRLD